MPHAQLTGVSRVCAIPGKCSPHADSAAVRLVHHHQGKSCACTQSVNQITLVASAQSYCIHYSTRCQKT